MILEGSTNLVSLVHIHTPGEILIGYYSLDFPDYDQVDLYIRTYIDIAEFSERS